ncbi:DEAD/DEAH box helicase [Sphaerotilus sp.]|uniref:DEAD/DEAH box helicase n=1 Tax=Sphaerotilus sp. TaxID=2093942 RepID=UPI00286DFBD4|nr:DEAD/DEAH box helicase [Sphaerotilus sp.]
MRSTESPTLSPEQRNVLQALALSVSYRTRTWILTLLAELAWPNRDGKRCTGEQVRETMAALAAGGWIVEHPQRLGHWRVHPAHYSTAYLALLQRDDPDSLRDALLNAESSRSATQFGTTHWYFENMELACAVTRLAVFSGQAPEQLERLRLACRWGMEWEAVLERSLHDVLDGDLFARMHPYLQAKTLREHFDLLVQRWANPGALPLLAMADALRQRAQTDPALDQAVRLSGLSLAQAEYLMLAGRFDDMAAVLQALVDPTGQPELASAIVIWRAMAKAFDAVRQFRRADWSGCIETMEMVLEALRLVSGKRKGLLPMPIAWAYPLALMAQGTPAALQKALKFCLAEGGKRQPMMESSWGVFALALQMKLGDARRDLQAFTPRTSTFHIDQLDISRWLVRAWLKDRPEAEPLNAHHIEAVQVLGERLRSLGLDDLNAQLDAAVAVVQARPAPPTFFVATPAEGEGWRNALSALAAIASGGTGDGSGTTVVTAETRLVWVMTINDFGALNDITPMEQKRGLRGWNKPKAASLLKLSKAEGLPTHDAVVARTLRVNPRDRSLRFDLAAAAVTLVGHPHVEFDDTPDVAVALTEVPPVLDVTDLGDRLRVTLQPPPRWTDAKAERQEPQLWITSAADQKEADALRVLTILRDGPQHARLVRFNAAQTRAAQLIGAGLEVPKAASAQLDEVLRSLGAHFQVHSDTTAAARDVPTESRLRAELTPEGDGVALRLIVMPFGTDGPRVNPGSGRARMITKIGDETLEVQRDLSAERSHLETTVDACPMLAPPLTDAPAAWLVEQPDQALALLERLHTLNAVMALDWPKGKAIRVDSVGLGQLKVNVKSGSEWLALQGGVTLNEQLVVSLGRLLDWSTSEKSRFIPMGEGRYLALTEELRSRLDELASVAEIHRTDAARVTPVAAAWLDTTLKGADLDSDKAFRERIDRLVQAQQFEPVLPRTLQATLRPYQEEGYQWAMRLAETGLGAVLADDMGLGKTLQALAVLLARAAGGPALVIAPTSLIGNWQAEARRFAPSLRLLPYAEGDAQGDRDALLADLGPQDVVLVSYQLQLLNGAAFAARQWHTLVLDEAQAIKNATAKRSQAVHELGADFRLALSGTPIENRLSELWSIMRVCNPGLLGTMGTFNLRFAVPIERDRHRGAQRTLRKLIAPFILRRTKAQVLDDLPPRTELTMLVDAEATEHAHYEALRRQALRDAEKAMEGDKPGQSHLNILAQLTKLRRAACDPRLVTPEIKLVGAKVKAFGELAAELAANGHKALVFSQFVDFLALLKEPLDAAGLRYQYLDGSTPSLERTKRVAAFQGGDGDFFLISLKAGGFGLNLTVADYVVIADPWWNPAAEDQASGRAHRIGQQRPVTVYRLVRAGTLEEKIVALHQDKRELADSVLEGSEVAGVLRAEELMALMQEGR